MKLWAQYGRAYPKEYIAEKIVRIKHDSFHEAFGLVLYIENCVWGQYASDARETQDSEWKGQKNGDDLAKKNTKLY